MVLLLYVVTCELFEDDYTDYEKKRYDISRSLQSTKMDRHDCHLEVSEQSPNIVKKKKIYTRLNVSQTSSTVRCFGVRTGDVTTVTQIT